MKLLNKIFFKFFSENGTFFIGSTDILPPPLTKDEEIECVIRSGKGDLKARNTLIEHNLRLVVFLAKKYDTTVNDLEELVSIGTIGLIKAVETYKLDKNIKLATYASRCIDNEILMFLRKNKRKMTEVSFEDTVNFDSEGNELKIEDIFGTDVDLIEQGIINTQNKDFIIEELSKLNKREKQIISMRYGLGGYAERTQKEVAKELNISQSYISRIEKKILKRIQNLI